jgi:hypothetical protein
MRNYKLALVFALFFALIARGESEGSDPKILRVEDVGYDVSKKVQALSLDPGRLKTLERKIDPTFGVLVDEAAFPEEGAIAEFLPGSGTLILFRRDVDKLSRGGTNKPLDKKTLHSKGMALLQGLGIESLLEGENKTSEDDWQPSKSKTAPLGSQEDVFDVWTLRKLLSYRSIPSAGPLVIIELDGQSGEPTHFLYIPVKETVDPEPRISSDTAKETADALFSRLGWKEMHYDATRLVIASSSNMFSREKGERLSLDLFNQRLAWEVKYSMKVLDHEHRSCVYVDAITGAVIGG